MVKDYTRRATTGCARTFLLSALTIKRDVNGVVARALRAICPGTEPAMLSNCELLNTGVSELLQAQANRVGWKLRFSRTSVLETHNLAVVKWVINHGSIHLEFVFDMDMDTCSQILMFDDPMAVLYTLYPRGPWYFDGPESEPEPEPDPVPVAEPEPDKALASLFRKLFLKETVCKIGNCVEKCNCIIPCIRLWRFLHAILPWRGHIAENDRFRTIAHHLVLVRSWHTVNSLGRLMEECIAFHAYDAADILLEHMTSTKEMRSDEATITIRHALRDPQRVLNLVKRISALADAVDRGEHDADKRSTSFRLILADYALLDTVPDPLTPQMTETDRLHLLHAIARTSSCLDMYQAVASKTAVVDPYECSILMDIVVLSEENPSNNARLGALIDWLLNERLPACDPSSTLTNFWRMPKLCIAWFNERSTMHVCEFLHVMRLRKEHGPLSEQVAMFWIDNQFTDVDIYTRAAIAYGAISVLRALIPSQRTPMCLQLWSVCEDEYCTVGTIRAMRFVAANHYHVRTCRPFHRLILAMSEDEIDMLGNIDNGRVDWSRDRDKLVMFQVMKRVGEFCEDMICESIYDGHGQAFAYLCEHFREQMIQYKYAWVDKHHANLQLIAQKFNLIV